MAEVIKTGENTVRVTVEVNADEVRAKLEEVYRGINRKVRIPGFRPGKAPLAILKQRYAATALQELVDNLVPAAFERAEQDLNLETLGNPRYEVQEVSADGPLRFTADVAVFPQFQLPDYSKFVVKKETPRVSDDDVARALDNLRELHARLEPVGDRGALDDELVLIRFRDTPPEGFTRPQVGVWAAADPQDRFGHQVLGKKPGDVFPLGIDYPADYPVKAYAGKTVTAEVEVIEVKRRVLPPLDDDFAKDLGEDSLAALKEAVTKRLARRARDVAYVNAYHRFVDDVLARTRVPLSPSFVEEFVNLPADADEKKKSEALTAARKELERYFVVRAMARAEGISVSPEQLREALAAAAADGEQGESPASVHDRLLNEALAQRLIPRDEPAGDEG